MGRKLNLSHLSDEECRQVLAVIQRDFKVRQKEKDRVSEVQQFVEQEAQKRLVLSRQREFNERHCICCFSTFGMIFNKKVTCKVCKFYICKDCAIKGEGIEWPTCVACVQQTMLQEQACEWFYNEMKVKFRRFGSAKVVRSLYKRQSEGSESSEGEHNSDSGVDHQFSPLVKKGGAFKREGSAETIDEETNTEIGDASLDEELTPRYLLENNPGWLANYKPPSESIGVQYPEIEDEGISVTTDELLQSVPGYWDHLQNQWSKDGIEDSPDGGRQRRGGDDDDQSSNKKSKQSSRSQSKDSSHSSSKNYSNQNTLQAPPDKNRDGSAMHVLSPIQEVSSPESSAECHENENNRSKGKKEKSTAFKFPSINEEKDDRDKRKGEMGELEGVDGQAFSQNEDGDTPLRHPIRLLDAMSNSFECIAGMYLDGEDQMDSLETHMFSPQKNLSDVASKGKPTAIFTERYEASDRNGNVVEIESVELSCSSDDDDDYENEELEENERGALSFKEFLKQIQDTTSGDALNWEKLERSKEDSKKERSKGAVGGIEQKPKEQKKSRKSDPNSSPNKKTLSRRSRSTGDFKLKSSEKQEEPDKSSLKFRRLSRSPSNRFIRYDSLPLVVEVYEADANSPSPSFKDSPDFNRFVYDSGQDSETTSEKSQSTQKAGQSSSIQSSDSFEESNFKVRQPSLESGTTEGSLPNSTSISSLSSTADGDRRRSADSIGLKSSFDSDLEMLIPSSLRKQDTLGDDSSDFDSAHSTPKKSAKAPHLLSEKRQSSLVKQDQVSEDHLEALLGKDPLSADPLHDGESTTPQTDQDTAPNSCQNISGDIPPSHMDYQACHPNSSTTEDGEDYLTMHSTGTSSSPAAPCKAEWVPPIDDFPSPLPTTTDSPKYSPATQRKNKESVEIANLTKKFCMKQEEVLKSAEDVLSSASQLSEIQSHIDKLERVLNSLERKVAGDSCSSISSFDSGDENSPPQSPKAAKSRMSYDMQSLHHSLGQLPDVSSPSEMNMASAVRMITSTALKVLSTTEDIMEAHRDDDKDITAEKSNQSESKYPTEPSDSLKYRNGEKTVNDYYKESHFTYSDFQSECEYMEPIYNDTAEEFKYQEKGDSSNSSCHNGVSLAILNFEGFSDCDDEGLISQSRDGSTPLSQMSLSPSSSGSTIFRISSGKDSPPTATLLFTFNDVQAGKQEDSERALDRERSDDDTKGHDGQIDGDENKLEDGFEESTVSIFDNNDLFADEEGDLKEDFEKHGTSLPLLSSSETEVSVFDHHFGKKNGVIDPLTALYNQVTELEEKVYLSAGKVYTLEERLHQLEQEVEAIDDNTAEDILAALEDKLALTVAQVSQNDLEVVKVGCNVSQLLQKNIQISVF